MFDLVLCSLSKHEGGQGLWFLVNTSLSLWGMTSAVREHHHGVTLEEPGGRRRAVRLAPQGLCLVYRGSCLKFSTASEVM